MSQIDKNPSGPPKVEPHPPSTKPASSPLTMSHPAFAPAYISAPAAQYSQYPSSPTYLATAYPTGHEQWQHSPQQYANMPTGQYYATSVQLASPDAVNGAYIPQYGQWMPSSPIDEQRKPTEALSSSMYHPTDPSMPPRARAGEPGPARTNRTTRRRSTQDAVSIIPQVDGEGTELAENGSSPSAKRSKTGIVASTSTDKTFLCDLCSATFTRKGDCLRHRRSVHTHETPYDCQGCGENFSRSDVRGKHWKASPDCESLHWKEVCRAMGRSGLLEQDK